MMYGNGWYGNGECGLFRNIGFSGWHYLIMLGLVIVIVAIAVFVRKKNRTDGNQALTTLKELFVKGEITEAEYLKRKNVIER